MIHIENSVNSGKLLIGNAKDNPEPSSKLMSLVNLEKVQRLSREGVHSSEWKRGAFLSIFEVVMFDDNLARFWSFVEPISSINTCWNWIGGYFFDGYGRFWYNGKDRRSHRFIYEYYNGELADNLVVRHTCHNSTCVNPNHLVSGTHLDNVQDKVLANRHLYGSKCPAAKLSEYDVREILIKIWNNEYTSVKEIADQYGVDITRIYYILNGREWKHITNELQVPLCDIKSKIVQSYKYTQK